MDRYEVENAVELREIMEGASHIECWACGSSIDEDDEKAFAVETGECPFCHVALSELDVDGI